MASIHNIGLFTACSRTTRNAQPVKYFNTSLVVYLETTTIPDACVT